MPGRFLTGEASKAFMVTDKTPKGLGWSADGKFFHSSRFRICPREPDHDEIVEAVVGLFKGRVKPGRRLKSGKLATGSAFVWFELLDLANDLAELPPCNHESRCDESQRVRDSHVHDACLKLGIPVWWVHREFAPLVERGFNGVRFDREKRRYIFEEGN